MKRSNAGRITRPDQAWAAAHRENVERLRIARIEAFVAMHPDEKPGDLRQLVNEDHDEALRELGGPIALRLVAPQRATPVEVIPATQSITVPIKYVQAALLTSSKDDIRHYLNGIYIHAVGGDVRIVGTDGHRLCVSSFKPLAEEQIPSWAAEGFILPREELAQALPILLKNSTEQRFGCNGEPSLIIDHKPGEQAVTVRSVVEYATFKMKPIDGKYPEYARVLASAGSSLVRGEGDAMTTTAINAQYLKGAADIATRLGSTGVHSFLGDGQAAAVFTFDKAPDTLLIIMPMRGGEAVSDGVVKLLGSGGVAGSIGALRAHVTRTVKLLGQTKNPEERAQLEARKEGFEQRIVHIMEVLKSAPKALEAA